MRIYAQDNVYIVEDKKNERLCPVSPLGVASMLVT